MAESSDLSYIEIKEFSNPVALLFEWTNEAKLAKTETLLVNLATATKSGQVNNRTVVVREIISDGSLAFTAQLKSKKIEEITENPQVAATILLMYVHNEQHITRQIRIRGVAGRLPQEQCKNYFEKESLAAKIRTLICKECQPIEWESLKRKHDEMLQEVVANGKVLEMPDTQLAYKIVPNAMEFYFSADGSIADRILFEKINEEWTFQRVMP